MFENSKINLLFYSLIVGLICLSNSIFSQAIQRGTIFSSAGHYGTSSNLQLQSNIGELMTNTFSNQTILTQGFVQPEPPIVTFTNNYQNIDGVAYPNPVSSVLYLVLNNIINSELNIEVFDMLGNKQIVEIKNEDFLSKSQYQLHFEKFDSGIYFVRIVSQDNKLNKTFKVNKD